MQSRPNLLYAKEMSRLLGVYLFDDQVHVVNADTIPDYPQALVIAHEQAHRALTRSSVFGMLLVSLATIQRNMKGTCSTAKTQSLSDILSHLVSNCFNVQEAIATYDELSSCKQVCPEKLSRRLGSVPPEYRRALALLESCLGPIDDDQPIGIIEVNKHIAVTLCRCSMDSPELIQFKSFPSVSLDSVSDYLRHDAPDRRLSLICNAIRREMTTEALRAKWAESVTKTAESLGLDLQHKETVVYWHLDEADHHRLLLGAQEQFLQDLGTSRLIPCPWIATVAERTDVHRVIVSSWHAHFKNQGCPDVFPFGDVYVEEEKEFSSDHRCRHHLRESLPTEIIVGSDNTTAAISVWWALREIEDGRRVALSFEDSDHGPIIVGWPIGTPLPTRIGRIQKGEFNFFGPLLYGRYSAVEREMEQKIFWHFQGELLESQNIGFIVNSTQGRFLVSWETYSRPHVDQRIEYFLTETTQVIARMVKLRGSEQCYLVITGHLHRVYVSWPCTFRDLQTLESAYKENPRVIVGKTEVQEAQLQCDDGEFLSSLLAIAYGHRIRSSLGFAVAPFPSSEGRGID